MSEGNTKTPVMAASAIILVGLALAVTGGLIGLLTSLFSDMHIGLLIGGLVAMLGVIPSAWGAWRGMQQETQTSLAFSLGMVFFSLGIGALLIVLWVIQLIRS